MYSSWLKIKQGFWFEKLHFDKLQTEIFKAEKGVLVAPSYPTLFGDQQPIGGLCNFLF